MVVEQFATYVCLKHSARIQTPGAGLNRQLSLDPTIAGIEREPIITKEEVPWKLQSNNKRIQ